MKVAREGETSELSSRSAEGADLVLFFDQLSAADLPRVGGKGANLGEMTRAGLPVPPGFCVTTEAFRRFMAGDPDREAAVYAPLAALAPDDVAGASSAGQQDTYLNIRGREALVDALRRAWVSLFTGSTSRRARLLNAASPTRSWRSGPCPRVAPRRSISDPRIGRDPP